MGLLRSSARRTFVFRQPFDGPLHPGRVRLPHRAVAILPLRVNNAISDIILIDSLGPDFTVAGFAQQIRAAISASSGNR